MSVSSCFHTRLSATTPFSNLLPSSRQWHHNQSIICAVFDPKIGIHGPPNVSLLSFSLEFLYLISPLHLFMSFSHIMRCLPTPRFPSILPSKTLIISLPLDTLRMCPRKLKLSFYNLLHKILVFSYHFQNLIIWHKSSPADLEHSPVTPHLKCIYPSFCFLYQRPRLWSICKNRKDMGFNYLLLYCCLFMLLLRSSLFSKKAACPILHLISSRHLPDIIIHAFIQWHQTMNMQLNRTLSAPDPSQAIINKLCFNVCNMYSVQVQYSTNCTCTCTSTCTCTTWHMHAAGVDFVYYSLITRDRDQIGFCVPFMWIAYSSYVTYVTSLHKWCHSWELG